MFVAIIKTELQLCFTIKSKRVAEFTGISGTHVLHGRVQPVSWKELYCADDGDGWSCGGDIFTAQAQSAT